MSGASSTVAAWRHVGAREGFEVVFLVETAVGRRLEGCVCAVEDGRGWTVRYDIAVDAAWRTRSASVRTRSAHGCRAVTVEADGDGGWLVDGEHAPALDGCLDVDLESSSFTNALPVHRLGLAPGEQAEAPAVFVRATDLRVERLEQRYERVADDAAHQRYDYSAPRFGYSGRLVYDAYGLLIDYPGIAERVA
jgi:uncharacterized protein